MMRWNLQVALLAAVVLCSCAVLRPQPANSCWCNFDPLLSDLQQLFSEDGTHAEAVTRFVHTLAAFNFKLTNYFSDLRTCTLRWLGSIYKCDAECSCTSDSVCCRDTALISMESSARLLKDHYKSSIAIIKAVPTIDAYSSKSISAMHKFSIIFDLIEGLQKSHTEANAAKDYFQQMIDNTGKHLNDILVAATNRSLTANIAQHYSCDIEKLLASYLSIYSSVLQLLVISEINDGLRTRTEISSFSKTIEWRQYLSLTNTMAQQMLACSTNEIYTIRTQEIKEKDVAIRNAAIVFSCFLLILILIIVLIAIFACRRERHSDHVTVRDEPVTEESDNRDLLYKRYYEADETV